MERGDRTRYGNEIANRRDDRGEGRFVAWDIRGEAAERCNRCRKRSLINYMGAKRSDGLNCGCKYACSTGLCREAPVGLNDGGKRSSCCKPTLEGADRLDNRGERTPGVCFLEVTNRLNDCSKRTTGVCFLEVADRLDDRLEVSCGCGLWYKIDTVPRRRSNLLTSTIEVNSIVCGRRVGHGLRESDRPARKCNRSAGYDRRGDHFDE